MQLHIHGQMGNKFGPDGDDQVLDGAQFTLHEFNVYVQVLMVQFFYHVFLNDATEFFYVEYETRLRVGISLYRYVQLKIMPVPVLIGAFAEHFIVLLRAPVGVIELMCSIKMFYTGNVNHC